MNISKLNRNYPKIRLGLWQYYNQMSLRFLLVVFSVILAVMVVLTIYPFNFFQPNRVEWPSNEPGLYFNGIGFAHTSRAESIYLSNAVTVELLLKERSNSKNWGPREIFSFYDGSASPPLLVGQWDGRIFIFSRFEKNEGERWYKLFRTKERFPRGRVQLLTVTFGEGEKAIYINGHLNNRKKVEIVNTANINFSGRLLLGNSPMLKNGWWGEIKGLAIFNRILRPDEIAAHSKTVLRQGMKGLPETPGCLALYPFDEREGNTASSTLGNPRPFRIPASRISLAGTLFRLSVWNMRRKSFPTADFIMNIIFFIPFGILLAAIIQRKYTLGNIATFLIVTLTAGIFCYLIEIVQLCLPTRYSGLSDVFGNVIGGGIGMLVACMLKLKIRL